MIVVIIVIHEVLKMQELDYRVPVTRIARPTFDQLREFSSSRQLSISAVVRQAILDYLDKHGYDVNTKKGGTVNE
jgi:hypothetical protein